MIYKIIDKIKNFFEDFRLFKKEKWNDGNN